MVAGVKPAANLSRVLDVLMAAPQSLGDGHRFLMGSVSEPGRFYAVRLDAHGDGCECPSFAYRRRACKHIEAARLLLKEEPVTTWTAHLSMPPRILHPNGRGHYHERSDAANEYRELVATEIARQYPGKTYPRFLCARLELEFVFRDMRRHDVDGTLAWFKHGLDQIVTLGILPDDDANHIPTITVSQRAMRADVPGVNVRLTGITKEAGDE